MSGKKIEKVKKHYAMIVGARPNFMKAAPLLKCANDRNDITFTLIHTGQHFDDNMSRIFFEEFGLKNPDIYLGVDDIVFTEKMGLVVNKLKKIFAANEFDGIIVFGDVVSTLAGAVAAVKNGQRLIHIEAGLRSYNRRMPEETVRVIVDHISDVLFTTEPSANTNLKKEGIPKSHIHFVGNLMIESIELFRSKIQDARILSRLGVEKNNYIVATLHRQENTDSSATLVRSLSVVSEVNKHIPVIMPLHPGTKKKIEAYKLDSLINGVTITDPLGYFEFMNLAMNSRGVITDSGGIQEETTHLGIPCCTLRDNTERPITVKLGSNKLFSPNNVDIKEIIRHLNRSDFKSGHISLWDSSVSERIINYLL